MGNIEDSSPGPGVIKLFSYSTQLSTTCILLINVKIPTIVGILTFLSMINTTSETVGILVFMSILNFVLSCVEHEKSFITSGPVFSLAYSILIVYWKNISPNI